MFLKYTPVAQSVFAGLRPVVVGLLAAVRTPTIMQQRELLDTNRHVWQFFISLFLCCHLYRYDVMKINPIRMICYAAFCWIFALLY